LPQIINYHGAYSAETLALPDRAILGDGRRQRLVGKMRLRKAIVSSAALLVVLLVLCPAAQADNPSLSVPTQEAENIANGANALVVAAKGAAGAAVDTVADNVTKIPGHLVNLTIPIDEVGNSTQAVVELAGALEDHGFSFLEDTLVPNAVAIATTKASEVETLLLALESYGESTYYSAENLIVATFDHVCGQPGQDFEQAPCAEELAVLKVLGFGLRDVAQTGYGAGRTTWFLTTGAALGLPSTVLNGGDPSEDVAAIIHQGVVAGAQAVRDKAAETADAGGAAVSGYAGAKVDHAAALADSAAQKAEAVVWTVRDVALETAAQVCRSPDYPADPQQCEDDGEHVQNATNAADAFVDQTRTGATGVAALTVAQASTIPADLVNGQIPQSQVEAIVLDGALPFASGTASNAVSFAVDDGVGTATAVADEKATAAADAVSKANETATKTAQAASQLGQDALAEVCKPQVFPVNLSKCGEDSIVNRTKEELEKVQASVQKVVDELQPLALLETIKQAIFGIVGDPTG
jgi:hypothetical protein